MPLHQVASPKRRESSTRGRLTTNDVGTVALSRADCRRTRWNCVTAHRVTVRAGGVRPLPDVVAGRAVHRRRNRSGVGFDGPATTWRGSSHRKRCWNCPSPARDYRLARITGILLFAHDLGRWHASANTLCWTSDSYKYTVSTGSEARSLDSVIRATSAVPRYPATPSTPAPAGTPSPRVSRGRTTGRYG